MLTNSSISLLNGQNAIIQLVKVQDREKDIISFYHEYINWKTDQSHNINLMSLVGMLLVRNFLCEFKGVKNSELKFTFNSYGKPYYYITPPYFNISHSGDYVVVVFYLEEIGIDIEKQLKIDMRFAYRFFTEKEVVYINQENEFMRFYEIWTRKEAYLKARGIGLTIPLNSFEVCYECKKVILNELYYLYTYNYLNGYSISMASLAPIDKVYVQYVYASSILENWLKYT